MAYGAGIEIKRGMGIIWGLVFVRKFYSLRTCARGFDVTSPALLE